MLEPTETPEEDSGLRDFEALLQQMRPAPSQLSEPELFYQLGYAAKTGVMPATSSAVHPGRNSGRIGVSFGGGLVIGMAASWMLISVMGLWKSLPSESEAAKFANEKSRVPDSAIEQRGSRDTEIAQSSSNTEASSSAETPREFMSHEWDDAAIRAVIYRGTRRPMWHTDDRNLGGEDADSAELVSESRADMNNLNWRRSTEETWLD
jgi:hypothetical protein